MKTTLFKNSAIIAILSCMMLMLFATMTASADTKITSSKPGVYSSRSTGYYIREHSKYGYTTGSSGGSWGTVTYKSGSTTYSDPGFVVTKNGKIQVNGSNASNPYVFIPKRYKVKVNGSWQYLDLKITIVGVENLTEGDKIVALKKGDPADFFVAHKIDKKWSYTSNENAKFRLDTKMELFLSGTNTLATTTDGNFDMRMDDFDSYQYFGINSGSPAKCYGLRTDANTSITNGWYTSGYKAYHTANHEINSGGCNNLYYLLNNPSKQMTVNCYWGFQKQAGSEVNFYGNIAIPTYSLTINKTCDKAISTHGNQSNHFNGTIFALYNSLGARVETKTITSGSSVTFTGLPPGEYSYEELSASSGHNVTSGRRTILVTSNATVSFQNKAKTDTYITDPDPDPPNPTPQPPTPQPQPPTPTYTPPTTTLNVKLTIQKSNGASAGKSLSGYKIQLKSSNNTYTKYTDALGNVSFPGLTLNTSHTITCSPPKNNTWSEWGNSESIYNSLEPAGGKVITSNNSESSLSTTYNLLYRSISEEEIAPIDIPDTAIYEIRYIDEEDLKRIENEDAKKRPDWFSDLKEILKQSLQKKTSSEAKARYNKEGKPVN